MPTIEFDIAGLEEFADQIKRMETEYKAFQRDLTQKIGSAALKQVIKATPKGKHLTDVAFYAREYLPDGPLWLVELWDVGTPGTMAPLAGSWYQTPVTQSGNDTEVEVNTDKEYAPYVEEGHATVAFGPPGHPHRNKVGWYEGQHFNRDVMDKIEKSMPLTVSTRIREWLTMMGVNNA